MTSLQKGLLVGALQVLLAVSVPAKFAWDRATRPKVWVKATPATEAWLLSRGRYVRLHLLPAHGSPFEAQTENQTVAFFLPEHAAGFAGPQQGMEIWVEVTIPKSGAPRPVRVDVRSRK